MKPADQKIYLASKSPRRRELLRQVGVEFQLLMLRESPERGPDISEAVIPGEAAIDYVIRVTREKLALAEKAMYWRRLPVRPILTADTTVTIDDTILGKPANRDEAIAMMRLLSGRTHQVMTSVAVRTTDDMWQSTNVSSVTFATLTEQQIRNYCALAEPYDKAGGYGIQGQAAAFIAEISGSYSGIMGLPLHETAQLLEQAGIRIL
ncbi:nucleoside triphosphate pyrophosphatase [Lacisediminimonas sp.]|uniref:Maf family protein n=1 Tax=Lacisediminimonas sp. TaxID=3060582 RepID=UPI002726F9FB|nr:Maf family protein [Lacisediminimonas sp.]MDO8298429.1 Maf family protein [Lacisediminimonas sp.]